MDKTRILWSGITGRTGIRALKLSDYSEYSKIVYGVCRNDSNYLNYDDLDKVSDDFDVIVDFSHRDSFDKVLEFALKRNKPLIVGTSGLSEEQLKKLEEASYIIPVFKSGTFIFRVEEFIKDIVEYAKNTNEEIKIVETHYKTKKVPSETAKVIAKRIFDATGKEAIIESHLEYDELINDWQVGKLRCRVEGFDDLARDVLRVASIMKDKKPSGLYNLKRFLEEYN